MNLIGTALIAAAVLAVGGGGATVAVSLDTPPEYVRAEFGPGWRTTGPNCDTRDVVLHRDLEPETDHGCDVVAGTLVDPYTGQVVTGPTSAIQIDHVVPLALAWRLGAWRWTREQRVAFANDPDELLTTTASENRAKGDQGLDTWLPPHDPCQYALRFDSVADRYGLEDSARNHQVTLACGWR